MPGSIDESFRTQAEKVAADAAERARSAGVDVETKVGEGQPADVLIEISADADLLVVGSRGRGGFKGLMLGSAPSALTTRLAQSSSCAERSVSSLGIC